MNLTERQKKHLRRLAHSLKPVLSVGDKGVTEAFVRELDGALEHHELIKVRVRGTDRDERDAAIASLSQRSGACLIGRIGNVATLFRQRRRKSRITLPPPG